MKSQALFLTLLLSSLLTTPSYGQGLNSDKSEMLQQSMLTITVFDADEKIIRQGRGFFANSQGQVVTSRRILRDAIRAEVRTFDNNVYPVQVVSGTDIPTGLLKLTVANLPDKITFLPVAAGELKDKEPVFILNAKGSVKLSEGTNFSKTSIPALGQFLKVTAPVDLDSSGNAVFNAAGELVGVLVVETVAGKQQTFIVPKERLSRFEPLAKDAATFDESNKINTSDWLLSGPGLYYKGVVLEITEGCNQALAVFESSLEEDRNNAHALFLAGRCKAGLGHVDEAIEDYRSALRRKPDLAEAHFELGNAYVDGFGGLSKDAYQMAIEEYKKAVAINPNFLDAYQKLGIAYRESGSLRDEIKTYQKILEFRPNLAEAHLNLGVAYSGLGDLSEAITQYSRASRLAPSMLEPLYNLGNAYLFSGQTSLAREKYKETLRIDPFLGRLGLGTTYLNLGLEDRAISEYRKAVNLEPSSPLAYFYLGNSYARANRYLEAANAFETALKLRSDLVPANTNLALTYWKLNQPQKASEVWPEIKNFDSNANLNLYFTGLPQTPMHLRAGEVSQFIETFSLVATATASSSGPIEKLFTASWFTNEKALPIANDLATGTEDFLHIGTRYFLKIGLQDTPFEPAAPGTISESISAKSQPFIPGSEMEVTYFSKSLAPQQATLRIQTPEQGKTSIVAFPVTASSADPRGVRVWVEIRLKGLAIYNGELNVGVVPETGAVASDHEPGDKNGISHLTGTSTMNEKAVREYEELKTFDVEILVTPQPNAPFDITIDWKGKTRITKPSGLNPISLTELLTGVRSNLKAKLDLLSGKKEGSKEREIDALKLDPQFRQQLIYQLAKLGHRLYDSLFDDPELRQLLDEIKTFARDHRERVLRIQIRNVIREDYLSRLLLPLGLLYDDPDFSENSLLEDAKAENFWDSRYQIEFNETLSPYKKKTLCDGGPIRVAAVMDTGVTTEGGSPADEWRQEVREQQNYLKTLHDSGRIRLNFARNEDEFLNIFRGDPSPVDIIYYYGHTDTSPPPSFSLTNSERNTGQIRDAAKGRGRLKDYPFVFLNSCKGVAFSGDSKDTFLNVMNSLGASGFIGTEASVRIPYAAAIGQAFFKKLMSYKTSVPIVQVLREMKHEALSSRDGNPLIMIYSIYGDPSLRTCSNTN